ncbi:MAG: CoA-binding protein [Chitinophagaceae bacterium]
MNKKTLVIGASEHTHRYSNKAMAMLKQHQHEVVAIGKIAGNAHGIEIQKGFPALTNIDTITLYLNPSHQEQYYEYIMSLKPKRVIFNPGTENETLEAKLNAAHIAHIEACTLVLLSTKQY